MFKIFLKFNIFPARISLMLDLQQCSFSLQPSLAAGFELMKGVGLHLQISFFVAKPGKLGLIE
jgi:hypothetical protein